MAGSRRARRRTRGAPPRPDARRDGGADHAPSVEAPRPGSARITSRGEDRPLPPWGRVPLTEVAILVGAIVGAVGLLTVTPRVMAVGVLLAGAAAGELAIREHFAGYRSHSSLLAGLTAVLTLTLLVLLLQRMVPGLTIVVPLVVAAGVFAGTFVLLRRAFRARAGVAVRV